MKNSKLQITILLLISAITWLNSLHSEFVGYDDINLIINNSNSQKSILETFDLYWNTPSCSYNTAWTNIPSSIFRPLQWVGTALIFKILGNDPIALHFWGNYIIHIANTLLVFLILKKLLSNNKQLAFIISLLWTIHPLHNEAINMLTSGMGFLLGHFFALLGILLLSYSQRIICFVISFICFFLAYLGSEMTITIPIIMTIIYANSIKSHLKQLIILYGSASIYLIKRFSILSDTPASINTNLQDLFDRIFVLAPQILNHYYKLLVFPAKLTIDQSHNIDLGNSFSFNHIASLALCFILIGTAIYFFKKNNAITAAILISFISIAPVLNIIPLYVLARERYCYIFTLATIIFLVLLLQRLSLSSKFKTYFCILLVLCLSARSMVRNKDWSNGEQFWISTIQSVEDIGSKQVWRYNLIQYYENPGTTSFVPNKKLKEKELNKFYNFISNNQLDDPKHIKQYIKLSKEKSLNNKYNHQANKTIASGLGANVELALKQRQIDDFYNDLRLAHLYLPEHFHINLRLLSLYWNNDRAKVPYFLNKCLTSSLKSPYLARWFLYVLNDIKHPDLVKHARIIEAAYPKTKYILSELFKIYRDTGLKTDALRIAKIMTRSNYAYYLDEDDQKDLYDNYINNYN